MYEYRHKSRIQVRPTPETRKKGLFPTGSNTPSCANILMVQLALIFQNPP